MDIGTGITLAGVSMGTLLAVSQVIVKIRSNGKDNGKGNGKDHTEMATVCKEVLGHKSDLLDRDITAVMGIAQRAKEVGYDLQSKVGAWMNKIDLLSDKIEDVNTKTKEVQKDITETKKLLIECIGKLFDKLEIKEVGIKEKGGK